MGAGRMGLRSGPAVPPFPPRFARSRAEGMRAGRVGLPAPHCLRRTACAAPARAMYLRVAYGTGAGVAAKQGGRLERQLQQLRQSRL